MPHHQHPQIRSLLSQRIEAKRSAKNTDQRPIANRARLKASALREVHHRIGLCFLILAALAGLFSSLASESAADESAESLLNNLPHQAILRRPESPTREFVAPIGDAILTTARADLGDLRLIERRVDTSCSIIPMQLIRLRDQFSMEEQLLEYLPLPSESGTNRFYLKLKEANVPVNRLIIQIDDSERNYRRSVEISGGNNPDDGDWSVLESRGLIYDVSRPGHRQTVSRVDFPESTFRWYRVVVSGNNEVPLKLSSARLGRAIEWQAPRTSSTSTDSSVQIDKELNKVHVVYALGDDPIAATSVWLGGDFPVDGYFVTTVSFTDQLDRPWRTAGDGLLFRFRVGMAELVSREISFPPTRGRWVRLTLHDTETPIDFGECVLARPQTYLKIDANVPETSELFLIWGSDKLQSKGPPAGGRDLMEQISNLTMVELGPVESNPLFGVAQPKVSPPQLTSDTNVTKKSTFVIGFVLVATLLLLAFRFRRLWRRS